MIIQIIHIVRIACLKAKGDAPVSRYPNRPVALQFAFERMQPESRQVYIVRLSAAVENRQNIAQANDVLRRYAFFGPPLIRRR